MFSVTQRIKTVSQPYGGYLPAKKLKETKLKDGREIKDIPRIYSAVQGLAVDYLSRFMSGVPKETAFAVSLMGASAVGELPKATALLDSVNGLNKRSVLSACRLVGYDVAKRRGKMFFRPVDTIVPDDAVIENIIVMVERSLAFFEKYGPVVKEGFTFNGGYTEVVSSGDGDFLTEDTLWDFKASKKAPDKNNTLQLLMYYILGIHSVHPEFENIKKIGIFNPLLNTVYTVKLSKISDEIFKEVSNKVLGYKVPQKAKDWKLAKGTDEAVLAEVQKRIYSWFGGKFDPYKYKDGIHDISFEEYKSFWREKRGPSFCWKMKDVDRIRLLKNSGFIMFIGSSSDEEKHFILDGGRKRKAEKTIEYYFEKMPEYANTVLKIFSPYWDALSDISNYLNSVKPDKVAVSAFKKKIKKKYEEKSIVFKNKSFNQYYQEQLKKQNNGGFISCFHGCIVDLDYYNHLYVNPFDGTVTPYFAKSVNEKYVYKNIESLIASRCPEMLGSYITAMRDEPSELLCGSQFAGMLPSSESENGLLEKYKDYGLNINTEYEFSKDTDIYKFSNKFLNFQRIYEERLIVIWNENIVSKKSGILYETAFKSLGEAEND